jgi:hypothetical protein
MTPNAKSATLHSRGQPLLNRKTSQRALKAGLRESPLCLIMCQKQRSNIHYVPEDKIKRRREKESKREARQEQAEFHT